jgi:quercetin dioxygenase-like cupin family protein
MLYPEFEKGVPSDLGHIVAYRSDRIVSRNVILRSTGSVTVFAFAKGEETVAAISRFDSFVQILDGAACIHMNDRKVEVKAGQILIIPAHTLNQFIAKVPFKMLSITIKSGFEDAV